MLPQTAGNFAMFPRYVVDATEIVKPSDIEVLRRTDDPELTLVTCYPFACVGPAPKRFVVRARQDGTSKTERRSHAAMRIFGYTAVIVTASVECFP